MFLPPGIEQFQDQYQGESMFLSPMYIWCVVCVVLINPIDPGYIAVFSSRILVLSEFLGAFLCLHLDKPPLVYFASLDVGLDKLISKPLWCLFGGLLAFPFLLKCVDIILISPLSVSWRFCVALAFRSVYAYFFMSILRFSRSFPRLADSNALWLMVGVMDWCSTVISGEHFGLANFKASLYHGWRMMVHQAMPMTIIIGSIALVFVLYIDGLGHTLYWRFSSLFMF